MKEKKHFGSKKPSSRKLEKSFILFYLLIFLISCENTDQSKSGNSSISLSLMVKRADIMWYQMQIKGFEDACTNLGVQFLILDNKMDSNLTLTNIDTLISRKIDGVAIAVTEQKMSWIIVNRIFEAGIPIISLNNKLIDRQGRQLAPHIGIDYSEAGIFAGKWLEKKMLQHSLISNKEITLGIAELNSAEVKEINKWTNTVQKKLLNGIEGLKADMFYRVNSPENDAAGAMLAMQQLIST
ncbi:MAG: substrate-binding domain-containing protein, partial [Spirochaetaceae bacterium]|nr:substrate-binding domain-containing protein [Spirochaetaceae bacterium]